MKKYSIDIEIISKQLKILEELRSEKGVEVIDGLKTMLSNIKEGLSDDGQIILTRK